MDDSTLNITKIAIVLESNCVTIINCQLSCDILIEESSSSILDAKGRISVR